MASVTFLGTGGGRYVVLSQKRYSGGIWLDLESQIIVDPGPGALIRAIQYKKDPQKLDAIIVSHKHLDHYSDTEILIEGMTSGTHKKRGTLVIEKNTVEYVSEYHRNAVKVIIPEPGEEFSIGDLRIKAIPTSRHVQGLGFRFQSKYGVITYSSDTDYDEENIKHYRKTKILILNTIFPSGEKIKTHLNADKALLIAEEARPELLIITHFGQQMLTANPEKEAKRIENETGVTTIAAGDGLEIDLMNLPEGRDKQSKLI